MAFTSYQANIGTTDTVVMTAASTSMVLEVRVANTYRATVPVDISLKRGSTITYIRKQVRVDSGSDYLMSGSKLVLLTGDQIIAKCAVASAADITVSIINGLP